MTQQRESFLLAKQDIQVKGRCLLISVSQNMALGGKNTTKDKMWGCAVVAQGVLTPHVWRP